MARIAFAQAILLIFVLFSSMHSSSFVSAIDPMTINLLPPRAGSNFHTMFLPLFPPPRNSTFSDGKYRKQNDSDLSNAWMNLHDDVSITGYYTTRLWIGTPPQKFALIVDTGSTVTYVPCSTCEHCGKHQDPSFDLDLSTTYQPVRCNTDCKCDYIMHQCTYVRNYAEMSSSSGVIGDDVISFGDQSELSPQRLSFGCEMLESGKLYTQRADGIMGLGRGDLSIVDQLVDLGVITNSFSLCYGGMDVGGGAMVLGGISPPSGMVYAYSDPLRSPFYNVDLEELHVAGKRLPLDSSIFDTQHGTILDSGTTFAYMPKTVYLAFKDAILKELHSLKQIEGPDSNSEDICFSGAGSDISRLSEYFPSVELVFGNGIKLSLTPENYLFRHLKVRGAYCLGILQSEQEQTITLGGIIVRNTFVMYDREHDRIGFWKTNCADLLARLTASGVLPSTPNKSHSSSNTSPQTPLGPRYHNSPGSKVRSIRFHMSLNMKYSKLEPLITVLTQLIVMDLHVDGSQVSLLDFISEGSDSSLTTWAITPLEPAEYMSKETASDIIAPIAADEIQLPKIFGKHHISNWYIEFAPNRKTWWQKNMVAVITSVLVLALGFFAVTTGWLWRYKQRNKIAYRPIGPHAPGLELQTIM